MTIFIISSSVAIVVSFLCSLAEALLLSLNPLTLSRLQTTNPRAADSWRRLKRNIAHPITAILVLNTISHTGGATVAGGAFADIYGESNIWVFSVLFTIIILFGTEILPKIIGVTFRDQLAPVAAAPLLFVMGYLLIDQPDCFNPWNDLAHSGAFMFAGMWILCLPALLAAVVCTVNAVFGLLGTLRSRSIEQVAGTETIPKHA